MEKKICALLFTVTFIAFSSVVHGSNSNVHRNPSVDPIVEIDIEDAKVPLNSTGFNFVETKQVPHVGQESTSTKTRVPANIVSKSEESTTGSMIGPLIFLIALPIGLWIAVSKKLSKGDESQKVDYYPKTQQFRPLKTEYQKSAEDDDDIDYPKAS